jgi:hypothetical protein
MPEPQPTPQSGADLLARIKPRAKEVTTELCMRPDLLEAHEAAHEALALSRANDAGSSRLTDGGVSAATKKAAQAVAAIEAEIAENVIVFRLRAMPQDKWRALCDNHPPRKGNDMDFMVGYDRDAVTDAGVRACIYDPVFDDASWATFMSVCNPSEWQELRQSFTIANQAVVDAPKSALASQILEKPGRGSRRQPASE